MSYLLVLLAVSFAVSALGWIYFIYFFSIGYGFSVSALAVTIAILFHNGMTVPTAVLCAVWDSTFSEERRNQRITERFSTDLTHQRRSLSSLSSWYGFSVPFFT